MADIDSNLLASCVPVSTSVVGVGVYIDALLPPHWLSKGDCPKLVLPNVGAVDWAPNGEFWAPKGVVVVPDGLLWNAEVDWPKAGVDPTLNNGLLEAPKAGALKASNAGVVETPNAGVLEAPNAEVLEEPNIEVLDEPNIGLLEAPDAPP
jgi:hypothetical protein